MEGVAAMLEQARDNEQLIERVAALDVGKAEVTWCARVPDPDRSGGRLQEVGTCSTMTRSLLRLADRLSELGVTRVVMEATGEYWKSPFYLFEAAGLDPWLVNAKDVKHLPGRPKTDKLDAVWLCKVAERQMVRPSFVPPPLIRELRDLTRYRTDLTVAVTAEKQRVEKLLEDAQIKLSVVASDIFGVSGRAMMAALVAGERDPKVLAQLARARMRAKISDLREAFHGRFNDHHAFLLSTMLTRIDTLQDDMARVEARIEEQITPFADAVTRLDTITGIGTIAAWTVIAEIGVDMTRFPTANHLVSWAGLAPLVKESAGRKKGKNATGHGNSYLARVLGQAVLGVTKTNTFFAERYRRIARRRGKKKAIVAVSRSILIAIWHVLSDPTATYIDLGATWYDNHRITQRVIRHHVQRLHELGYTVTLTPAPAPAPAA
jgi:transposase